MLPDYPSLKQDLLRRLEHLIKQKASDDPFLRNIPSTQMHEGRRAHLHRHDGSSQELAFDNPAEATVTIRPDDIRQRGPKVSFEVVESLASGLQAAIAPRLIETLERTTEEVGNSFDAGGQPLSPEHVLQMLDRIELLFAPDGTWQPPKLMVHPSMETRAQAVLDAIEHDATLKARRDTIVDRQREEWRVREARRKLVD